MVKKSFKTFLGPHCDDNHQNLIVPHPAHLWNFITIRRLTYLLTYNFLIYPPNKQANEVKSITSLDR